MILLIVVAGITVDKIVSNEVLFVGKVKRGNYLFVSWIGDHGYHVHVFKDNKLVVKWDLEKQKVIEGKISKRVGKLINELVMEK